MVGGNGCINIDQTAVVLFPFPSLGSLRADGDDDGGFGEPRGGVALGQRGEIFLLFYDNEMEGLEVAGGRREASGFEDFA